MHAPITLFRILHPIGLIILIALHPVFGASHDGVDDNQYTSASEQEVKTDLQKSVQNPFAKANSSSVSYTVSDLLDKKAISEQPICKSDECRCNNAGEEYSQSDNTSFGINIGMSRPLVGGTGFKIVQAGLQKFADLSTKRSMKAQFCVTQNVDQITGPLFVADSIGVVRANYDGEIHCDGEIRHQITTTKDQSLTFVGNGWQKVDTQTPFWSTSHSFKVLNIKKGIPLHEVLKLCQEQVAWGYMNEEAEKAKGYPNWVLTQFNEDVACLEDKDCPTPKMSTRNGLQDIDLHARARCLFKMDASGQKRVGKACVPFVTENGICDGEDHGWGIKRSHCDEGLECRYVEWRYFDGNHRSPFGKTGFVNINRCLPPERPSSDFASKVGDFYRHILGREPDADGLMHYFQRFKEGASLDQIESTIEDSPEFDAKANREGRVGQWYQVNGNECRSFCKERNLVNVNSPEGTRCVSGEVWVQSAQQAGITQSFGCYGTGCRSDLPGNGGKSFDDACYMTSVKHPHDGDKRDKTIGCYCR